MLEKFGLPPRPSMPGGAWVLDASHCRGCNSQFTFFNRKHHCRRCGDIFCSSCTQQRMTLRGQGDALVRICEPCKKIEEAARFELRHGHRTRKAKANSKQVAKNEDAILQELIEDAENPVSAASRNSTASSSSSMPEVPQTPDKIDEIIRSVSYSSDSDFVNDVGSSSPEELRRLAQEEKNKHRILKSQGKRDEALAAFKHGKELERQAAALEIVLRKNRKLVSTQQASKRTDHSEPVADKKQLPSRTSKSKKDDLANELKELGWSDADVHDAERKPEKQSIESELSSLLRGSHTERKIGGMDKSQVIAHKKRALELKRAGKLAEAKEELRQAKLLEKELEEQELLAGDDESDDEIAALVRGMGDDKTGSLSFDDVPGPSINFDLSRLGDDFSLEPKFDVTDDDMNDPEMAAALEACGWSEDVHLEEDIPEVNFAVDNKRLAEEILALKREAVEHKKAGNLSAALEMLKKAKMLEKERESLQDGSQQTYAASLRKTSVLPSYDSNENVASSPLNNKQTPKSKAVIQRELLTLKRKALALKREGHIEEAEEELKRGKVLELQLEQMEKVPKPSNSEEMGMNLRDTHSHRSAFMVADLIEGDDTDVTDQDMEDPALLSVLKNLGWEDDSKVTDGAMKMPKPIQGQLKANVGPIPSLKPIKSKAEIQKELLTIKRRALALRRQGKAEEAEEELRKAGDLENQLKDLEVKDQNDQFAERDNSSSLTIRSGNSRSTSETPKDEKDVKRESDHFEKINDESGSSRWPENFTSGRETSKDQAEHETHHFNLAVNTSEQVKDQDNCDSPPGIPRAKRDQQASDGGRNFSQLNDGIIYGAVAPVIPPKITSRAEIQRELLVIKRRALALRKQGKVAEANEELAKAQVLEDQLDAIDNNVPENERGSMPFVENVAKDGELLSVSMSMDQIRKDTDARYPEGSNKEKPSTPSFSKESGSSNGEKCSDTNRLPSEPVNLMDLLTGDVQNNNSSETVAIVPLPSSDINMHDLLSDDWNNQTFLPNKPSQDSPPFYLSLDEPKPQDVSVGGDTSDQSPDHVSTHNDGHVVQHSPIPVFFKNEVNETSPVKETETADINSNLPPVPNSLKDQILAHKRRALILKREGKLAEAREELKQAKLLERTMEGDVKQIKKDNQRVVTSVSADVPATQKSTQVIAPVSQKPVQDTVTPMLKPMPARDRFKLQQECLSKKRQAAKLRRDGKMDEAEALLEQANKLQAQLDEIDGVNSNVDSKEVEDDVLVEGFLDPQLLSALQSIGIGVEKPAAQPPKRPEQKPSASKMDPKVAAGSMEVKATVSSAGMERTQIEEQIRSEKLRALNFKRAGKQTEAMEALRSAKRLEKRLASLG